MSNVFAEFRFCIVRILEQRTIATSRVETSIDRSLKINFLGFRKI